MNPARLGNRTATRSPRRLRAVLAAAAILVAGCGSSSDAGSRNTTSTGRPDAVSTTQVAMKVLEFTPANIQARVGQTVTWTNEDTSPHNVSYGSGPRFTSSPTHLNPGTKFSIRLTQAGTIHYFCSLHSWMHGTITVSP